MTTTHERPPAAIAVPRERRRRDRRPQEREAPPRRESRPGTWVARHRRGLLATEGLMCVALVFASQFLRFPGEIAAPIESLSALAVAVTSVALGAGWILALHVAGAWDPTIVTSGHGTFRPVYRGTIAYFGLVAMAFLFWEPAGAKGYLVLALPLGLGGLLATRWVWRQLLAEHRRVGRHAESVLVVGSRWSAVELATRLSDQPGFRVVGICVSDHRDPDRSAPGGIGGFVLLGGLSDVRAAVAARHATVVAVAPAEGIDAQQVRRLAWDLEDCGARLAIAPTLTDVARPRMHIRPLGSLALVHVDEPTFRGPKLLAKTLLDFVVALTALVLLSPLLVVVAVLVRSHDGGPAFFRQERVGRGGRRFHVIKFRSMYQDADKRIDEVRRAAGQSGATFYKSADDPRITPIGRLIRRTSIDELPQLFNVLTGRMSIVGPRPLVPGEGAEIGHFVERRMLVKPGITGLWQVSGRSATTDEERVRLDFYYIENWSLISDLAIMARTAGTVLKGSGAY